jgi:Zn-finger nucleic acid-binding protein
MTKKQAENIRGRVDGAPRCPRCPTSALKRIGAVSACVNCGGVFVPASERDAMADALKDMADTADLVAQHAPRNVSAANQRDLAKCPVCLEEMQRFRVHGAQIDGRDVDIEVDSCPAHGAFYDRGELVDVQRAFAAGAVATTSSQAPPVLVDLEAILKS